MAEQNYTLPEDPPEKDTSVESLTPRHSLEKISKDLCEGLSPSRQTEVEAATQTAIRFAEKFGIKSEYLDMSNPEYEEAAIMLILIANEWQKTTDYPSQRRVTNTFRQIYSPESGTRRMIGLDNQERTVDKDFNNYVINFIKLVWPESHGDINWIKSNVVKDDLAVVPLVLDSRGSGVDGLSLQKEALMLTGLSDREDYQFAGLANPEHGFYLTFINADKVVIEHEKNHLSYPGLRVGDLGTSLNEGMTQWLAEEKVRPSVEGYCCYDEEQILLSQLFIIIPGSRNLAERKYKERNHKNTFDWFRMLVDSFGLSNTLKLYQADPYAEYITPEERALGVEITADVTERLFA